MQLKRGRKKEAYFYMHQNEAIVLSAFPNVHVWISPAGLWCAVLNGRVISATSPFSSDGLITTSILAEASGIVPVIHLVQHRAEVTMKYVLH